MFLDFVHLLREYGVPANVDNALDFLKGLRRGLVNDLDELFLFARLCFVRRVEQYDAFERAFAEYFLGVLLPPVAEGDPALFETRQFREWLRAAVARGEIKPVTHALTPEELMKKFWDTVRAQTEAHHGGSKWVGTGGTSPFGHSGAAERGVRVFGESSRKSALKTIGERRYVDYSDAQTLDGANWRAALDALKMLKPAGAPDQLDVQETIRQTARNGGEIELVFRKELRDRIEILVFIDNGGTSMAPYVDLTRLLFQKLRDRFHRCTVYYFHNTIYEHIYADPRRTRIVGLNKILEQEPDARLIFVGDASMAPEELYSPYGASSWTDESPTPSAAHLRRLRDRFARSVWLNPIPAEYWKDGRGAWTLQKIREIFPMEDLSLGGLKNAVARLNGGKPR